ncbi:MAG: hypothetical protein ACPGSC_07315 [Granulosicoccaceae bacterium]
MDIQSLLHNYPYNLLIAAVVGGIVVWLLCGRSARRALRLQREQADTQLSQVRGDLLGEIDTKNDDIAQLEHRLSEADHLTQNLSQKASLLANEQQRYADLKDRYLNDVSRARNVLKTRADASAELERRNTESAARYKELHQRWDTERKRYAKLVTEKNQKIADLESHLEGLQPTDSQSADPALHSYSHGQLESMLVDLRHQLAQSEERAEKLQRQVENSENPAEIPEQRDAALKLRELSNKLEAKEREIARLRQQHLEDKAYVAAPVAMVQDTADEQSQHAIREQLEAKITEAEHLKAEVERLQPAAAKLRRLETQLQQALRGEPNNSALTQSLELELNQVQSLLSKQQVEARLNLEKQASAFQRQINAKTDTISRLNRQLQASAQGNK